MKNKNLQSWKLWGMLLLWAMPMLSTAQSQVARGKGYPMYLDDAHWFLDTVGHYVWYRQGNADWEMLEGENMVSIETCMKWVIVKSDSKYSSGLVVYGKPGPGGWVDNSSHCLCLDSVLWSWSGLDVKAFGPNTRIDLPVMKQYSYACNGWTDTVQGQLAFCLTENATGEELNFKCAEMRNWGMMGLDQKWLIEPQFDAPFHFQDGIAEVMQYGKPRKINEKGEFVE